MKLEKIKKVFEDASKDYKFLGKDQQLATWAMSFGPGLIQIAEAAKEVNKEIDICGAGTIDAEFGISNIEDSYFILKKALEELEKE